MRLRFFSATRLDIRTLFLDRQTGAVLDTASEGGWEGGDD